MRLLDRQLQRLQQRRLRIALFGRVGVGKSSLINALIRRPLLAADVAPGSTRRQQAVDWPGDCRADQGELVDTPGIDEIDAAGRARLASVAMGPIWAAGGGQRPDPADLAALRTLLESGKPLQLVLNRSDRWPEQERANCCAASAPGCRWICRSPRQRQHPQPQIQADGRVRTDHDAAGGEPAEAALPAAGERRHPAVGDSVAAPGRPLPEGLPRTAAATAPPHGPEPDRSLCGRQCRAWPSTQDGTGHGGGMAATPPWCCSSAVSTTCR